MAMPFIDPLPSAPTPADPEAVFDDKAYEMVAALTPFVEQTNTLALAVEAEAIRSENEADRSQAQVNVATTEANRAQAEADRAKDEANRSRQAVGEAVVAKNAAEQSAIDAASYASAAAVAELPPYVEPGSILMVNPGKNGVIFSDKSLDSIIDSKIYKRGIGSSEAVGVALIEVGGNGGTFVHINEYNQVIDVTTDQFNKHEIWGAIEDVVIDGQDMVRIPKFYIKTVWTYISGYEGLKRIWLISLERGAGFRVHPAFMKNGAEIDQIYVGKYQASLEDGKLASLPGVLPAVSRSLTQFTNDALTRNVGGVDGFMLWSIYQLSAIQMLFMVEHKTMDSQGAAGQGRVSTSSAAEVDAEDVAQASYRGIVGLWGNVWQWCQGLRAVNGAISVWDTDGNQTFVDTPHKRAEDVAETIYPIDFFDESGSGYDLNDLFVGKTGPASNSGATAPDYNRLRLAGTFFCFVGGNWSSGSFAGLWALNVYYSSAIAPTSIGARLAKS